MENLVNPWKTGFLIGFLLALLTTGARAEIITKLPTQEKVVALTFDACETRTPSYFDGKILHYLLEQQIPFTLFVSGKFASRNRDELSKLAQLDFVEIENHSLTHSQHLERLNPDGVKKEVLDNERLLLEITQKKTRFFRFPAGNYDPKTLALVESLGYRVVHWSFASGDPDNKLAAGKLTSWVLAKTRPGSILIFHINGRGYQTGTALPAIVKTLQGRGYRFVKLEELL
jgi:peptidoglycan/xylan/chitin deacetylase (PgdA/CDA1 family)